jgi:hypothetical protein
VAVVKLKMTLLIAMLMEVNLTDALNNLYLNAEASKVILLVEMYDHIKL